MTWVVAEQLLGAVVKTGELYPCLCELADPDPPAWKKDRALRTGDGTVYLCDPYLAKQGRHAGTWQNRCGCWGMPRVDDRTGTPRPEGCCAWSVHNPAYAPTSVRGIEWRKLHGSADDEQARPGHHESPSSTDIDTAGPGDQEGQDIRRSRSSPGPADHTEAPATEHHASAGPSFDDSDWDEWDYTLDPGPDDHRILRHPLRASLPGPAEPYVRRWPPEEITCTCPTPWDGVKDPRQMGHHCTGEGCHQNFKNARVAAAHQKYVTGRCKNPARQMDVDGRPVYRPVSVGRFTVWQ